jgi:ABC-type spermidine/putrescine transport system permease subunit I
MAIVTFLYYLMAAYVSLLLAYNLIRSTKWEKDVLYILVLVPFLLRLFRLK